jgi:hypothetical protein
LCIIVLNLDPSNPELALEFEDSGWNPSFLVELGCDLILNDLVCLRSQVLGYSISETCFTSPRNLASRAQAVWEIHGWIGGVDFTFSSTSCSVHTWRTVRTWQTIRTWSADCRRGLVFVTCSSVLELEAFRSAVCQGFRCKRFADRPTSHRRLFTRLELSTDRPKVGYKPSIFRGAVLVVRVPFVDRLLWSRGLSAQSPRTVRPVTADCPPGTSQIAKVLYLLSSTSVLL